MTNRRSFLKTSGLAVAAVAVPGIVDASTSSAAEKKANTDIKLGIASYSLRKFTQEQALDMTLRCGVKRFTLKRLLPLLIPGRLPLKKPFAL